MLKTEKYTTSFILHDLDGIKNSQLQVNVIRIVQELISNIISHSKATFIEVNVSNISNSLEINVLDNGIGYEMNKTNQGIGIKNITKRVSHFNGTLNITSELTKGTTVKISIPIQQE